MTVTVNFAFFDHSLPGGRKKLLFNRFLACLLSEPNRLNCLEEAARDYVITNKTQSLSQSQERRSQVDSPTHRAGSKSSTFSIYVDYNTKDLSDLVRMFRNLRCHYDQTRSSLKVEVPFKAHLYLGYFTNKFPALLTVLFVLATKYSIGSCLKEMKVYSSQLNHSEKYFLTSDFRTVKDTSHP